MSQSSSAASQPVTVTSQPSPVRSLPVAKLLFDPDNPRLPRMAHAPSQDELLELIVKRYSVSELIESFAVNGYFDEEPLVAIPADQGEDTYTVVEGNRRLAALRLILDPSKADSLGVNLPQISNERKRALAAVPVRVHETRKEVLPYLGYRHITGVMTWDSYSKARYVAQLVEQGQDLPSIQRRIGDRHETAPRLYRAYLVWEQADAENLLARNGQTPPFSYLFTALTYRPILEFLGLTSQGSPRPVPEGRKSELRELTSYLYGNKQTGRAAAIKESRQIKDLAQALASNAGREKLSMGAKVDEALDAIPAEEARLERFMKRALESLLEALALAPRHSRNGELQSIAGDCLDNAKRLHAVFTRN